MQTIGLIGGLGCASTSLYYEIITHYITQKLGPHHTGNIIIFSLDEYDILHALKRDDRPEIERILGHATESLEKSGADFIIMCSNTMHKYIDAVINHSHVPVIHILVPICEKINKHRYTNIGILGTRITTTSSFYVDYLLEHSSAKQCVVPHTEQIDEVNQIIWQELLHHQVTQPSQQSLIRIVQSLKARGADCVILGCTELALILFQKDLPIPVINSTELHAQYAAERMMTDRNSRYTKYQK